MELRRNSHHVYRLIYHFVWIPKYRHKVFVEPYRNSLKQIIGKIAYSYDIDLVELEVPTDHIHMVVRTEPRMSAADVMGVIKSISAREFFRLYPDIKKKYFWGGKLWTQSYFVETIGNANEDEIRRYAQNQLKAMDKGEEIRKQFNPKKFSLRFAPQSVLAVALVLCGDPCSILFGDPRLRGRGMNPRPCQKR